MNYYRRHLGDYWRDAGHLTMLEHGALLILLDWYYANEKPIPTNAVYRLARCANMKHRGAVDAVLSQFFELTPEGWVNRRAEKELNKIREKAKKNSQAASARWQPSGKNEDRSGHANALQTQCYSNTPILQYSKRESVPADTLATPASEVPLEALAPTADRTAIEEWRKHRAVLGKPLRPHELIAVGKTLTAMGDAESQRAAVRQCIANGWMNIRIADRPTPIFDNARKTEAERAWADLIESEGATRGPLTSKALEGLGGWLVIRNRTPLSEPKLRSDFCRLYCEAGATPQRGVA